MKPVTLLTVLFSTAVHAGSSSADYAITTDTVDYGGQRTASADYANDGSFGPVVGVSNEATTVTVAKHGYIGQLYDVLGFGILFTDNYPPEGGATQVIPLRTLDDNTYLAVPLNDVVYTALDGPVSGISASGLITTLPVHQETPAMIRGVLTGVDGAVAELQIFVQDTIPDNFGLYGGDGLDDMWQTQHFGVDNPNAGPQVVTDGSGHTNYFKFMAGLVPHDAASRFTVDVAPVPAEPGVMSIALNPTFPDRHYTLECSTSLDGGWLPLTAPLAGTGGPLLLSDDAGGEPAKFYQVKISKQ
jgi:hypothetical protein